MRILFLTQWFDPEPSPIAGGGLVRWLRDQGHYVHVVTGFPNYPDGKIYDGYDMRPRTTSSFDDQIDITRVALFPSHDASAAKRMATYLSFAATATTLGLPDGPFDVIYAYQGQATIGIPALWAKRKYDAPVVLHVQDFWPDTVTNAGFLPDNVAGTVDRPLRWLCQQMYARMEDTIGLSPGMTKLLVDNKADADTAHTIINWAEEDIFLPDEWEPPPATSTCTVLYAGNLGPYQRVDIAIRAAAAAYERAPSLRLDVVGTGSEETALRDLIAEIDAPNVTMSGKKPYAEMGQLNHEADAILVSLDDFEFFDGIVPSKCQVGLAAGRPVVAALRGDARDLLERSGGAITCQPGSVDALADAFVELVELGPDGRNRLGQAGRAFYQDELSLAAGAAAIESVLETASQRHQSR